MKDWIIDYIVKEGAPSAIRSVIVLIGVYLAAKSAMLSAWGIIYSVGTDGHHLLTIDIDLAGAYLLGLFATVAGTLKVGNVHAKEALTKAVETKTE